MFATTFTILAAASVVLVVITRNWSLFGLVFALVAVGALSFWSVEIDEHEVKARATYGWPRIRVAASDIDSAVVTNVHPLRDWAGWGLRFNVKGDMAVVLRSGPALGINKKGGRQTVITVGKPEHAVDVLNRVLERNR